MSPRIAFTTACSGAPSKLKVDSPVLAARPGRGADAADWLMVWPLPRRTWARGASSSSSSRVLWITGTGGASVVPARWTWGTGVAHAASRRARAAPSGALNHLESIMGCTLRVLLRRCRRLLSLLAQAGASLLDPAPDRLGLLRRRDLLGRRGGFADGVAGRIVRGAAPGRAVIVRDGSRIGAAVGSRHRRGRLPPHPVIHPELEHA